MDGKKTNQTVVTFLNRDEVDFLDKLGKDALFSTGSKVSRSTLIAWMVDLLKGLNINGQDIRSEQDLQKKLMEAVVLINEYKERKNEK
jgi:hypothetical protein